MTSIKSNKVFEGICIFPSAYEIESFTFLDYNPDSWYSYDLINGRMIDKGGEALRQIICDFKGDETFYDGYIKGFIYANGKFLGKMHYVSTVNRPSESLNGTYNFINLGIELKGYWYSGSEKSGFFIRLKEVGVQITKDKSKANSEKNKNIRTKIKAQSFEPYNNFLTKGLVELITKKAGPIKLNSRATKFDHYQHVINLKPKPNDFDNVLMAMSIAYSWMPTMLDIYINDIKSKNRIVKAVQNLGTIKSLSDFESQKEFIELWLTELVKVINHSIVGVSKTLHIFFPKNIPIIDSRVLRSWNYLHKIKFKNDKNLKLPLHVPLTTPAMVNVYMLYWKYLLYWGRNTGVKDLRKIEEPLYWIGAKLKK